MRVQVAAGLWLAVLLPACEHSSGPATEPEAVIATTVTPASARLGDTVRVRIKVTNIGEVAVQVIASGCNGDFLLRGASGLRYYPAEQVSCPLSLVAPVVLAPGEFTTTEAFTTGRAIGEGSQGAPALLPPGVYEVLPNILVIIGDEDGVKTRRTSGTVAFRTS